MRELAIAGEYHGRINHAVAMVEEVQNISINISKEEEERGQNIHVNYTYNE